MVDLDERPPDGAATKSSHNDDLRDWLNQQVKTTIKWNMEKADFTEDRLNTLDHDDLDSSPFSEEIRLYDPPEKFSVPRFVLYDGTTDPASHLRHFTQ